jgi:hypothetical protein
MLPCSLGRFFPYSLDSRTLPPHYHPGQLARLQPIERLGTRLFVCRRHPQGQQITQGIHSPIPLQSLRLLYPSSPTRAPLSQLNCKVRPSKRAALSCGSRLCACRNISRRSCTIAGKQPASSQRRICWWTAPPTATDHAAAGAWRGSRSQSPTQPIEELAQVVLALRSLFVHQCQVRNGKAPFIARYITGVRFTIHHVLITMLPTKSSQHTLMALTSRQRRES